MPKGRRSLPILALPPLPGTLRATSWTLPTKLSYGEYERLCRSFGGGARGLSNMLQWAAGDLICYGERLYGEKTYHALEFLGFDERTLSNYARVASVFPLARRRALPLTHAHHAEVAALHPEEQDEWLDKAAKEGWTRAELRRAMKRETAEASGPDPPHPPHICGTCGATWDGQ
ncbi:MAG: hypothetical protein HY323_09325 [Betaproteobacteria bacterium]|nr:hypothetical protein [Betaproteobacteria bacterium]